MLPREQTHRSVKGERTRGQSKRSFQLLLPARIPQTDSLQDLLWLPVGCRPRHFPFRGPDPDPESGFREARPHRSTALSYINIHLLILSGFTRKVMFRLVWSMMSGPLAQEIIPAWKPSRFYLAHCRDPYELYLGWASEASGIHTVTGWSL